MLMAATRPGVVWDTMVINSSTPNYSIPGGRAMHVQQPRYSKEEHARRGMEMYEQSVRAQVEAGNLGRIVAIDIETGDFAVGEDTLEASKAVLARRPQAQVWCVRIGHPAVHHF